MTDEVPPRAPEPPPRGARFAESAARAALGVAAFVLGLALSVIATGNRTPVVGVVALAVIVAGLLVARKRVGPSPMLGAVAAGAGIALIVSGTCTLIFLNAG